MSSSIVRRLVLCVFPAAGACAVATPPFEAPAPADIPRLEAAYQRDPSDVDTAVSLAVGYADRGEVEGALEIVRRSREVMPTDPTLLAMQGMLEQEGQRPLDAARSFLAVLEMAGGPLGAAVEPRLDAVAIPAARARATELLTASDVIAELDPDRVVVIPFASSLEDRELAEGLGWLVTSNLAADGAEVVDAALTRSLAEGLDADRSRWTELRHGLRIATLTGAGHVVSASLAAGGAGSYSWDLTVTTLLASGDVAVASVPAEGIADELTGLASRLSSIVGQVMAGRREVALDADVDTRSPAELEPWLEFARAWEQAWAGDWVEARAAFERAASLDESFEEATEWATRAAAVMVIERSPLVESLAAIARMGERWRAVVAARGDFGSTHRASVADVGRRSRAELAELLGVDRLGNGVLLEITFGSPGAGTSPE